MSVLAGAIILAIMILPTIVSISSQFNRRCAGDLPRGVMPFGADRRKRSQGRSPGSESGIFSSIVLGMGRAIGETMAVLLITGNVAVVPHGIFSPAVP